MDPQTKKLILDTHNIQIIYDYFAEDYQTLDNYKDTINTFLNIIMTFSFEKQWMLQREANAELHLERVKRLRDYVITGYYIFDEVKDFNWSRNYEVLDRIYFCQYYLTTNLEASSAVFKPIVHQMINSIISIIEFTKSVHQIDWLVFYQSGLKSYVFPKDHLMVEPAFVGINSMHKKFDILG
jgi:hypothetical protein